MYRIYREIQNLDQNFSLKLLQNFSLSEICRMAPEGNDFDTDLYSLSCVFGR